MAATRAHVQLRTVLGERETHRLHSFADRNRAHCLQFGHVDDAHVGVILIAHEGARPIRRGRRPTLIVFVTLCDATSTTATVPSSSLVTNTSLPSGESVTPSGSLPVGTVFATCPVAGSTKLSPPASSFETYSVLPSFA